VTTLPVFDGDYTAVTPKNTIAPRLDGLMEKGWRDLQGPGLARCAHLTRERAAETVIKTENAKNDQENSPADPLEIPAELKKAGSIVDHQAE
jgi:hypothetical protein